MSRDERIKKDAEAHWECTRGVLEANGADELELRIASFCYVQAFRHGAKHALAGGYREDSNG